MPGYPTGLASTMAIGTTAITFRPLDAAPDATLLCWFFGPAMDVVEIGVVVGVAVTTPTIITFYRSKDPYTLAKTQTLGTVTVTSSHTPAGYTVRRYLGIYSYCNPGEAIYAVLTTPDTGSGSRGIPYCVTGVHEIGSTALGIVPKPYTGSNGVIETVAA